MTDRIEVVRSIPVPTSVSVEAQRFLAAGLAVGEVIRFLRDHEGIDKVLLVGFDSATTEAYREALQES